MTFVYAVVPAHMASTRFPGKVLAPIAGVTMLERVWRAAERCRFGSLILGTPDLSLAQLWADAGRAVRITSVAHKRCTDCVAQAALEELPDQEDIIVNIQSDEPLVEPDEIRRLVERLESTGADMAILARPIAPEERTDPNAVKVVRSATGRFLYSTRAPIATDLRMAGIFAWRPEALDRYAMLPESPLETLEACDSNRLLDHDGFDVMVEVAPRAVPSVDVPADIARVEKFLAG